MKISLHANPSRMRTTKQCTAQYCQLWPYIFISRLQVTEFRLHAASSEHHFTAHTAATWPRGPWALVHWIEISSPSQGTVLGTDVCLWSLCVVLSCVGRDLDKVITSPRNPNLCRTMTKEPLGWPYAPGRVTGNIHTYSCNKWFKERNFIFGISY
jgi:hypothetical protein